MTLALLKLMNKVLDFCIKVATRAAKSTGCIHSTPACSTCHDEWMQQRLAAGGW